MKMKKSLKKILAIVLVFVMAVPLAVTAFAAVSQTEAEEIALKHANVNRADAAAVYSEADYEFGEIYKYEVSIFVKNTDTGLFTEYEVDVKVSDGKILKFSTETTNVNPPVGGTDIGQEKAKHNAFEAFGVLEESVSRLKVKKDFDNGRLVYEIEFYIGNDEYSCEVDGYTGVVFELEIDQNELNDNIFSRIARLFEMIMEWFKNIFKGK